MQPFCCDVIHSTFLSKMTDTSSSTSRSERLENWRKRCYLTEVPADFLRISSGASTGGVQGPSHPVSHQRAGAIGRHPVAGYSGQRFGDPNIGAISGYLRITVNQVSRERSIDCNEYITAYPYLSYVDVCVCVCVCVCV